MKPTLLILAAGMGSRYGGTKQLESVGVHGEMILEYSLFDAVRAGFGRAVFVIRRDIQKDFDRDLLPRFSSSIPCEYVFQDITDVPAGISLPRERKKPWGTAHAVLSARKQINEPFAVINADDFYGRDAFQVMSEFLALRKSDNKQYAMVGYQLIKTVSENGTVSRGICQVDKDHLLQGMVEHTKLELVGDDVISHGVDGRTEKYARDTPVSMNFFGFTPAIFSEMEAGFANFLRESGQNEKSEFYIPIIVNTLIQNGTIMKVLNSHAEWFGITYKEDRPAVVASIRELVKEGVYPSRLWA